MPGLFEPEYVPGDEYDWDRNDDSQYCEHGTFIGSWWGPDVLCGYCEEGISAAELREIRKAQRRAQIAKLLEHEANLAQVLTPFSGKYLDWWVHSFAPHMMRSAGIFEMSDWEVP